MRLLTAPSHFRDNQDDSKTDGNAAGNNEQKEDVKEVMTLDEWKKIRGEREKPQYNLRKAGEGEDLSQWKNMRELQKEKETEFLENGYGNHHGAKKIDNEKVCSNSSFSN
jgi:plasminogen activator inhibitor 1 RNA-binding protein